MNSPLQIPGSPLWQLGFISFAIVLVLFEIVRGWRRGGARQFARLAALVAGYLVAYFGGPLVAPFIAPFARIPDLVMSMLVGAVMAIVVYAIISGLGMMLFRRTQQHDSSVVRLVYGLSGALLGIFFGGFLVWLVVVGVRSLGALAEAKAEQQATADVSTSPGRAVHAVDVRRGVLNEPSDETSVMTSLARMKNSLEMGAVGDVVKKADVIPPTTYEILGKVGKVASDPESAQRFLSFPGARELSSHPKIVALRDDPAIQALIAQGRYLDLLQDQKIIDAVNDPELFQQIKKFDLQRALDYSLEK